MASAAAELPVAMQAVRVAQAGPADSLRLEAGVPVPVPGEGEVLVRNRVAGVNFIDTYHRSGLYPVAPSPFTPGVEGAGVVAALGPGVTGLRLGDEVSYITRPPVGSYAQYTAVHSSRVAAVPPGLNLDQAAASMIQGMTAMALVTQAYPVAPGDVVLVTAAAGGTGRLVAQLAAAAGAHAGIAPSTTSGDGSYNNTITFALTLVVADLDILRLSRNNVRPMRPALWDFIATREEFESLASRTLAAVAEGRLKLHIGGRYPLAEAAEAHRALEGRRTTGKLLLDVP
ncbi:hypothetical protein GPECTOR_5g464 [Gonium pectorale]|uniref:Enoyl reductase (ER) domain-containing protein n=1 Tax=Gonium pectorale TaxID=33097 RepID=A0A150GWW0_GONPE|nr:hypothetical protein GPECTOR_5g464 [Gonium pectorale]|eukprot:KXZ54386.1 hypothetical protein GPECTOR_5g464 [Gonium pectorale]